METQLLRSHLKSWQQHLRRISPFLASEEGIWWRSIPGGYTFHNGDTDEDSHNERPLLLHYRSAKDVEKRQSINWEEMLKTS